MGAAHVSSHVSSQRCFSSHQTRRLDWSLANGFFFLGGVHGTPLVMALVLIATASHASGVADPRCPSSPGLGRSLLQQSALTPEQLANVSEDLRANAHDSVKPEHTQEAVHENVTNDGCLSKSLDLLGIQIWRRLSGGALINDARMNFIEHGLAALGVEAWSGIVLVLAVTVCVSATLACACSVSQKARDETITRDVSFLAPLRSRTVAHSAGTMLGTCHARVHEKQLCPEFVVVSPGSLMFNITGLLESRAQEGVVAIQDTFGHTMLNARLLGPKASVMILEMAKGRHALAVLNVERAVGDDERSISISHASGGGKATQCHAIVRRAPGTAERCFVVRRSCGESMPNVPNAAAEGLDAILMNVVGNQGRCDFLDPSGVILATSRRHSPSHSTLDVAHGVDASEVICVYVAVIKNFADWVSNR